MRYIDDMTADELKELYNDDVYPGMTNGDVKRIDALNRKNHYGISYEEVISLAKTHRNARKKNNLRTMSKIEYRLTDINFHSECAMMEKGEYDELISMIENEMRTEE